VLLNIRLSAIVYSRIDSDVPLSLSTEGNKIKKSCKLSVVVLSINFSQ
jgi:hypothetical protein